MPDTLSQESMQEIRDRHPDDTESEVARLLAHIDALTAALEPYIEGRPDTHIVPMTVGQLRAILRGEQ